MKIALVTPSFSRDDRDWCIPVLRDYASVLTDHGAEVHVFPLAYPPERRDYAIGPVAVHAVGGPRLHSWARDPRVFARAVGLIVAEGRRTRFDAVHAVFADECGPVALAAAWRLGVPLVVTCAGGELVALRDIGYGCDLVWPRALSVRLVLRRAACVHVPCAYMDDLYRRRADRPAAVIPWGVDVNRFKPDGTTGHEQTVLCVAELRPVKDAALLANAFARVASDRPAARLRFVGGGVRVPDHALAGPVGPEPAQVDWAPKLPWDRLPAVYRAAGLYAQSSRHEAFGVAVIEALASGLPVVGTAVGVLPEVCAGPDAAGLSTAPGDEVGLAAALATLLDSPVRRTALAAAARLQAERRFAWEVVGPRFWQLYANL